MNLRPPRVAATAALVLMMTGAPVAGIALADDELSPAAKSEIAAAEVNRALMRVRPEWKSGPRPEFPESERALGHHGVVKMRGILGVDGRVRYARVTRGSG